MANGSKYDKRTTILNRSFEWVDGIGISLTADPRHVKVMLEQLQCINASPLKVPMDKRGRSENEHDKQIKLLTRQKEKTLNKKVAPDPG